LFNSAVQSVQQVREERVAQQQGRTFGRHFSNI